MSKPNISWLVYDDDAYMPYNNFTADGSYSYGDTLTKRIQIWNNYNGKLAIDDAIDARLVLSFKNYEDNFLLNLTKVRFVGDEDYLDINIDIDRGIIDIGTLYGNASGYSKEIELTIGPIPNNLKSELKSLIFYIEYNK